MNYLFNSINFIKNLWRSIKSIRNARLRSEIMTRMQNQEMHYQAATYTFINRFPVLFEQCATYFKDCPSPKLISFGCSTGEEVFTLANYLPQAEIIGVDINKWCLKQCVKKNSNPKITFVNRLSPKYEVINNADAVFCLAVFQRTENRINKVEVIKAGITFEKFEQEIVLLDKKLKVGGLLFIDHCDFRFADTNVAQYYEALTFENNSRFRDRYLYGSDNKLMATSYTLSRGYVKRREAYELIISL
jgi:hypothetical protein